MPIDHSLLCPLAMEGDPEAERLFEPCAFSSGRVLAQVRRPASPVYFLASGVAAMTGVMADGRSVDVATIGRNGFTGSELLLGGASWNCRIVVRAAGGGWRISAGDLLGLAYRNEQFRSGLVRYAGEVVAEVVATALACSHGSRTARVARWIATMQERLGADVVPTTHEAIAHAIGAHRPGVTSALHLLEGERLIRLERGRVQVVDRRGLLATAIPAEPARTRDAAREIEVS